MSSSLSSNPYNTLILSSGGMRNLAGLGALEYLSNQQLLDSITTFIGTSAGSIIAYLTILQYSPLELLTLACTHPIFKNFPDSIDVMSLFYGMGGLSFSPFQETLEELTIKKTGILLTLRQILDIYGKKLVVSAFNQKTNQVEYFAPDTHPDMPALMAIRLSCSIPLVFKEMAYMDATYLDAALVEVFPVGYLQGTENAIGILIEPFLYENTENNLYHYIHNLMSIPTKKILDSQLKNLNFDVIKINPDIHFLDYTINSKTKLDLFITGYNGAQQFFEPSINLSESLPSHSDDDHPRSPSENQLMSENPLEEKSLEESLEESN